MKTSLMNKLAPFLKYTVFLFVTLGTTTVEAQYFIGVCPAPPIARVKAYYVKPVKKKFVAVRPRPHVRKRSSATVSVYYMCNPFPSFGCSAGCAPPCYNEDVWMPSTCSAYQSACNYYDVIYERPGADFIMDVNESPVYDMGTADNDIY